MKKYTAIIVEDENLPMLSLIQKLNEYHPDIDIVDSCGDADTALASILRSKPDVLFLDILLPDKDSLWLLEQLQMLMKNMPYIIFTTAYSAPDYLLKAIKFQAVDYLLKPVGLAELAAAIARMREKSESENSAEKTEKKYTFHAFNSTLIVSPDDIVYFEADGNYCTMFTAKHSEEPVFERLGEVEAKLSASGMFVRAGKSHLINRKYIYKIDAKKHVCHLKSLTALSYQVNISETGMKILMREYEK
jgi:DNA-binding LytR/AlgR family response regulator